VLAGSSCNLLLLPQLGKHAVVSTLLSCVYANGCGARAVLAGEGPLLWPWVYFGPAADGGASFCGVQAGRWAPPIRQRGQAMFVGLVASWPGLKRSFGPDALSKRALDAPTSCRAPPPPPKFWGGGGPDQPSSVTRRLEYRDLQTPRTFRPPSPAEKWTCWPGRHHHKTLKPDDSAGGNGIQLFWSNNLLMDGPRE